MKSMLLASLSKQQAMIELARGNRDYRSKEREFDGSIVVSIYISLSGFNNEQSERRKTDSAWGVFT